jgi:hypothetical protein
MPMDLKSQKFQHLEVLKFLYQLAPGNFISDEKVYKFYLQVNLDIRTLTLGTVRTLEHSIY